MKARRSIKDIASDTVSSAYRLIMGKDSPLLEVSDAEYETVADDHASSLRLWSRQIDELFERAPRKALAARAVEEVSFEARAELRSHWEALLDLLLAVDRIKVFHQHFPAFPRTGAASRHARSFALSYEAFALQLVAGLRLIRLTEGASAARTLLDEAIPEHGIPARRFEQLRWSVLHAVESTKLVAGQAYLSTLRSALGATPSLDRRVAEARVLLRLRDFADNGMSILRARTFDAWFPLQKGVALWMGETKIKKRPAPLISEKALRDLEPELRPGDIFLERRNWGLSNVGLPGFWPHAALYIGPPARLKAFLGADATRISKRHPAMWKRYVQKHVDGRPRAVIEALAAGVDFNSFEKSAGADYLAVLRPRLPAKEIAQAVDRAFGYLGRPYDFDFDFLTDESLVCSELVYKCFQPEAGGGGIPFQLARAAGRQVLPANTMAAQYDAWAKGDNSPLEFVAFLDGREKRQDCVRRDEAAFRESHLRPKWDFLQE